MRLFKYSNMDNYFDKNMDYFKQENFETLMISFLESVMNYPLVLESIQSADV